MTTKSDITVVHKGIRPIYPIQLLDYKRKIYYEWKPNGTMVIWNKRQLNSGCGKSVTNPKEMRGCLYCPWCDEWFSKDQWK